MKEYFLCRKSKKRNVNFSFIFWKWGIKQSNVLIRKCKELGLQKCFKNKKENKNKLLKGFKTYSRKFQEENDKKNLWI